MTHTHTNSHLEAAVGPRGASAAGAEEPRLTPEAFEHVSILRKILILLTPRERMRGLMVLAMSVVMAILETAGVATVLPFLAVLGNPAMVAQEPMLAQLYAWGGFASANDFLFALGVGAFFVIVFSALFRSLTLYVVNRYAYMRAESIGHRLYGGYLRQPYEFFLHRNSADLAKSILSETQLLQSNIFRPAMALVAYTPVVLALLILLVVIEPLTALLVAVVVAIAYLLIYIGVRRVLSRFGRDRLVSNQLRFAAVNEGLGGVKELRVLGREPIFIRRYKDASTRYATHLATSHTMAQIPKHLIEAVGFGGILAMALWLMNTRQDLGSVLPVLGLYAFAGLRLLPAAQNVYGAMASLRFGLPALDAVCADLELGRVRGESLEPVAVYPQLEKGIRFERVSYRYPEAEREVLNQLSLEIPVNTTVAFVGSTGSGKTTAVDLILALLEPVGGQILLDETRLTRENARSWQQSVGYVPQHIYLADATVAENIAFGVEPESIDLAAVEQAARIARIHDFVVSEMPLGYNTFVGERGVRLSGGQRQRIGIARALYHNPQVLIMDEATSALDNATEAAVMAAINQLSGQKTIILVAHRLTTVEKADQVFVFQGGEVKAQGRYAELIESDESFRHLSGLAME